MAKPPGKIDVGKIFPVDAVGDVHKETSLERHLRIWGDFSTKLAGVFITVVGFSIVAYLTVFNNADKYAPILMTIVGGAAGFLFGRRTTSE